MQLNNKLTPLKLFSLLSPEQYHMMIEIWNQTESPFPETQTLHHYFEQQVKKWPNRVALVSNNIKLTYQQLNEKSNQLAHYLVSHQHITPDSMVALMLDRNEYMLIAILAVLKAGGAYVPIAADYPKERIQYILEDTKVKVLLVDSLFQENVLNFHQEIAVIPINCTSFLAKLSKEKTNNVITKTTINNLAYVIYTSGTTGMPKGVMIEHKGILNLSLAQGREFDLMDEEKIKNCLWYANYVFDAHVSEVFTCILNGHCLHIIGNDIRQDLNLLDIYIKEHNINVATIPPALLNLDTILKLDVLIVAGEQTDKAILDAYHSQQIKIINAYGPTEATVCSTMHVYQHENLATNIGKPIINTTCYVLDKNLMPLPIGAIGELYVGGVSIARGYLNKLGLSQERFIANPFQTEKEKKAGRNAKLYKTGDLVRWLPNGDLDYIHRNDDQVKVRGYRIETAEIETVLLSYPGIKQAVVVTKEHVDNEKKIGNSKFLVGYYVTNEKIAETNLFQFIQSKLPEYMVPSLLVHLRKLPLNYSGKIDKKALLKINSYTTVSHLEPRNDLEEKIRIIWAEVLGMPEKVLGINNDFFRLGGDSIVSIQLVNQLRQKLGMQFTVKDIFNCRTIEKLAKLALIKEQETKANASFNLIEECIDKKWNKVIEDYVNQHQDEKLYWKNLLQEYKENENYLEYLTTHENNIGQVNLSIEETEFLINKANIVYHTHANDLLLTALVHALSKISNNSVSYIMLYEDGRQYFQTKIESYQSRETVDYMYPVRLEAKYSLEESIKYNKESLRQTSDKGIGFNTFMQYEKEYWPRIIFFDGACSRKEQKEDILSIYYTHHNHQIVVTFQSKLGPVMTKNLIDQFKIHLRNIIQHIKQQNRTYLTCSDVNNIITQNYLDNLQRSAEIEKIYLTNSLQQGFIFNYLNQVQHDNTYQVQIIGEYHCDLQVNKLKEAWDMTQKKFPALRVRFAWKEEIIQIIDKYKHLDWRYIDLSAEDEVSRLKKIKKIEENDRAEGYDLEQGKLIRVYLIKQKEDLYTFICSSHHIILDGWSNPLVFKYVHDTYLNLLDKKIADYSIDSAYNEAQFYLQNHQQDHLSFWQEYLKKITDKSDLSALLKDSAKSILLVNYKQIILPKETGIKITGDLYQQLKELCISEGVTPNAILQTLWHRVLSIYTQAKQTIVGMTISGRNLPIDYLESSAGLYINTLPLIIDHSVNQELTILNFIKLVQDDINEFNTKGNVALADLKKIAGQLFSSIFVYENYPSVSSNAAKGRLGLKVTRWYDKVDYPLVVIVYERNKELIFAIKYAGELFSDEKIKGLLTTFKCLLEQIIAHPELKVSELQNLNSKQYQQIIHNWSNPEKVLLNNQPIHKVFEEQVKNNPDKIALVYQKLVLTYSELNEKANQLAHYLKTHFDIQENDLVAICLDRNEQIIIAMLAILKAGGAYVPLDSACPDKRVKYILQDTNAKLVICNSSYQAKLADIDQNCDLLVMDNISALIEQEDKTNLDIKINDNFLAYIIYTSGTTGQPKGVMVEHKGVVSLVKDVSYIEVTKNDTFMLLADLAFDAATFEIWGALLNSAKLYIPEQVSELLANTQLLKNKFDKYSVSILWLTKSLFDQLYYLNNRLFENLTYLLIGGEKLDKITIEKLICSPYAPKKILNGYGPTENTTFSCTYNIAIDNIKDLSAVPIGKPLSNRTAYVLDQELNPLPSGVIGELFVGGVGLARGYLNKSELTAEKFILNPFQTEAERQQGINAKLYKTGDLVYWLADGNLQYVGRTDFQIKIRGHRVELAEIEEILAKFPNIKQCKVLYRKNLVGYYVAETELDEAQIIIYLRSLLPDYMVPIKLIWLKQLPLTINGKLDIHFLLEPELAESEEHLLPKTFTEQKLANIFAEILEIEQSKIGAKSNFFDLGGNSILAIKLINQINQKFNVNLKLYDLFENKHISALAEKIAKNKAKYLAIVPFIINENKPNLFMIHPAMAGCEVYLSLAKQLGSKFNCYGVDSYNLYHEEKIEKLTELAAYYLSHIEKIMLETKQEYYHLLGWSLGGQLALEIAYLLEEKGFNNIKLYLIDSLVPDKFIIQCALKSNLSIDLLRDVRISQQQLIRKLHYTKAVLFKAMQEDPNTYTEQPSNIHDYVNKLTYNNLDKMIEANRIQLFKFKEAHHSNILLQEQRLVEIISQWD